ncbi:TIGR02281 family clan AA aspartic protease [Aliiroseovarius sp.]|uniref:retropepsin-like aspartic protease family protein n=1 Tax=Aliiroseovarius sp. TaxID=1872442 RepID=UPI00261B25E7|nr:TIGR02281 family clan AA aspartic protease [Aliiroseovarius sp.]
MSGNDYGQLIYLALLGAAIVGYFIADNRQSLGKNLRMAIVWGLLFLGLIAAYGLWDGIRSEVMPRQTLTSSGQIEVPRGLGGHFYLVLRLNGEPVEFIVDTGASDVVLSRQDALRAGIDLNSLAYLGRAYTANGEVRTAPARIDTVELGNFTDHDLRVVVNEGEMEGSLLGMTYLRRFESLEIRGDRLILTR